MNHFLRIIFVVMMFFSYASHATFGDNGPGTGNEQGNGGNGQFCKKHKLCWSKNEDHQKVNLVIIFSGLKIILY